MSTEVKTGWLKDKNGDKFAPKTLISQVQTNDGVLLEDKIQADLSDKLDSLAYIKEGSQTATSTEDGGENIYTFTSSDGTTSVFVVKNGSKGADGAQGEAGPQGEKGEKGDQGDQGIQGEKGEKGDRGEKGIQGEAGYTPVRGTDYWTDADKAEIKSYVDNAILGGEW